MKYRSTREFDKQLKKFSKATRNEIINTIDFFLENPNHYSLRNHALKGEWQWYSSITVNENLRIHFKIVDKETVVFVAVGKHEDLYM